MSAVAKRILHKRTLQALARWPKDTIRPDAQLQEVLSKRLETRPATATLDGLEHDTRQLNALYSLLDNRYKSTVSIGQLQQHPPIGY